MKIKILLFLSFLMFLTLCLSSSLFASIDIGEEIFTKSFYNTDISNIPDSTLSTEKNTLQRVRLYLTSQIDKDIEAKVQLQAIGLWGSEGIVSINGYDYDNFNPFIEHAYIKASNILSVKNGFNVNLIIGKQPLFYGDGYILSDNNNGVFAYKLEGVGKFYDLDLWAIKALENKVKYGDSFDNLVVYAGVLKLDKLLKPRLNSSIYFVSENNQVKSNFNDNKNFLGLRANGKAKWNFSYKAEVAKEFGNIKYSTSTQTYDGLFYDLDLSLKPANGILKNLNFKSEYLYASGSDSIDSSNKNFSPYYTSRVRESNSVYYGEILSRVFPGIDNRTIIVAGIDCNKFNWIDLSVNYYIFSKVTNLSFKANETDFIFSKQLNDFISTRLIFAMLNSNDSNIVNNINHSSIEFNYKF